MLNDTKAKVIDNNFLPNCKNKKFSISMLAGAVQMGIINRKTIPEPTRTKVDNYLSELSTSLN